MEKRKTSPKRVIAFVMLVIGACTMVLPFLWMLSTSLKDANLVYAIPPQWIPDPVDWENYRDIWSAANLLSGIKNSLIVTVLVLLFSTLSSSMAAFAFAKLKFPAKRLIFLMLLSTMMVPAAVLFVPQYIVYTKLHWIDTYWAVIVPTFASTLGLYLMKQFMESSVSDAVLESARIDGASEFRTFLQIAMPMVKPAWLTLIVFSFQDLWKSGQSIYIHSEQLKTFNYAISQVLNGGILRSGASAASTVIMMIVPIIVFVVSQSNIMETMGSSGMKD